MRILMEPCKIFRREKIRRLLELAEKGIIEICHYVSPQHLHRSCAKFEPRYNGRIESNIGRFVDIVQNSNQKRLRYAELTANNKSEGTQETDETQLPFDLKRL